MSIKPSIRLFVGPSRTRELIAGMVGQFTLGNVNRLPSECIYYSNSTPPNLCRGVVKRGTKFFYSPFPGAEWPIDPTGHASISVSADEYSEMVAAAPTFAYDISRVSEVVFLPDDLLGENFVVHELDIPVNGKQKLVLELSPTDEQPNRCIASAQYPWLLAKLLLVMGIESSLSSRYPLE